MTRPNPALRRGVEKRRIGPAAPLTSPTYNDTWTFDKEKRLRELWGDREKNVAVIAEELGVSSGTISQKANRLGLPKRRPPPKAQWIRKTT